jgi:hypothetical protein
MKICKLTVLSLIIINLLFSSPAQAIGPGTGGSKIRVNDEQHGPYILLVATSPLPVTVGQMSVWVRVTGLDDNQLRRDAKVMIEAMPASGGAAVVAEGSHKNAGNEFDYVAHLELPQSGQWDVKVTVADQLGEAEVSFRETVAQGRSASALVGLAVPFVVLAIIVGIYLWRRSSAEGSPD